VKTWTCRKDHVFGVGFKFGSFNKLGNQNPKREKRELMRERERERERERARERETGEIS